MLSVQAEFPVFQEYNIPFPYRICFVGPGLSPGRQYGKVWFVQSDKGRGSLGVSDEVISKALLRN